MRRCRALAARAGAGGAWPSRILRSALGARKLPEHRVGLRPEADGWSGRERGDGCTFIAATPRQPCVGPQRRRDDTAVQRSARPCAACAQRLIDPGSSALAACLPECARQPPAGV